MGSSLVVQWLRFLCFLSWRPKLEASSTPPSPPPQGTTIPQAALHSQTKTKSNNNNNKTREMYSLTVLEAGHPRSLPVFSQHLMVPGNPWHPTAGSCITPHSASAITWWFYSSFKATSHEGLGHLTDVILTWCHLQRPDFQTRSC